MSKFLMLLSFCLLASFGFAQNGNSNHALDPIVKVEWTENGTEKIEIRISGQDANAIGGIGFFVEGMRASALPMSKTSGSNGNTNNGTSIWTVELDLDQFADENGNVILQFQPSCCRPIAAIQIKQ